MLPSLQMSGSTANAAVATGQTVRAVDDISFTIAPGERVTACLRPFGGARIIRGHAGLCDGPLDADGALEQALGQLDLALAQEDGAPRIGDHHVEGPPVPRWQGGDVALTVTEFTLLRTLAAAPTRFFSRDELIDRLHGPGFAITDRTIDSHVRNLRRKFAEAGCDSLVETRAGVGYRLGPCTPV